MTTAGAVMVTALVASIGGAAVVANDATPTYEHAAGIEFGLVAPSVWKVIDPNASYTEDGEFPEWHQGVEVALDGTVWLWGPGGIRTLGDSPIGDDPADWEESMSGIVSKASGMAVAADGTVWANIDSQIRSFDGTGWTTHQLDWEQITPPDADDPFATYVSELPDGSVWAAWQSWYDDGYELQDTVASFDGAGWTEHEVLRDHRFGGVAGTPDGDAWVRVTDTDPVSLMRLRDGEWNPIDSPFSAIWSSPAGGPGGTLWVSVTTSEAPEDTCSVLARFVDSDWRSFETDDDEWCAVGLFGLEVAPDGSVWSAGDGVTRFDGSEWTRYLEGMFALDVAAAPDGTIWVAAAQGVFVIRP